MIGYVEFNWIFNVYDEYELKTKYISGQYKLLGMYSLLTSMYVIGNYQVHHQIK